MATSMNRNDDFHQEPPVGFLLIFSEIFSNEQLAKALEHFRQALATVDYHRFEKINDLFNALFVREKFQIDCQYRQIETNVDGSIAGFLYRPNFHTVNNVIQDYFNTCSSVFLIYCGQQIFNSGDLILIDSCFKPNHFLRLFQENKLFRVQNFYLALPFPCPNWKSLAKYVNEFQLCISSTNNIEEIRFGKIFYDNFLESFSHSFDIYSKLIAKDAPGTIAFDEPNLYIFSGQQGDASLFGIRGFVILINGGFSRLPSYWNLIRELQMIDACILTHFDYDVLPGLQTVFHRKTIRSSTDGKLCKPQIGTIFLNKIQLKKIPIQSSPSNNSLVNNLNENINEFLDDVKQLNIETHDLVKQSTTTNKTKIEPINLFKKIAFGSLDLFVLHPTASANENDKIVMDLQKNSSGKQISSSIPLHHWYSSCFLLVWNSKKNQSVRILHTGSCPQSLVFQSLDRARDLSVLHVQPLKSTDRPIRFPSRSVETKSTRINSTGKTPKPNSQVKTLTKSNVRPTIVQEKNSSANRKNNVVARKENFNSQTEEPVKQNLDETRVELERRNEIHPEENQAKEDEQTEIFVEPLLTTVNEEKLDLNESLNGDRVDERENVFEPNDEMEIIEHQVSNLNNDEEIDPKGLPIEKRNSSFSRTINVSSKSEKLKMNSKAESFVEIDVVYIPHHGDENYVDEEFFRRIHARFYILNAVDIRQQTLEALINGKAQWETNEQVTLVPTFDSETLRHFFIANKLRLGELKIQILPASTRCQVQDDDESSPAQLLRFNSFERIAEE